MSGDGIGFMDPHKRYFVEGPHGSTSCNLWKFSEDSKDMQKLQHQFQPFREHQHLFGVTDDVFSGGGFKGKTLFRFPLRSAGSKQQSELSENIYTPEKVHKLFSDLKKDGVNLLLFLMNLQHIEVYELKSNQRKKSLPQKLFRIGIEQSCLRQVIRKRQQFKNDIDRNNSSNCEPLCVSYPISIRCMTEANDMQNINMTEEFIVSLYYNASCMSEEVKKVQKSLRVLPWVGAAIPVNSRQSSSQGNETEAGQIFCFLPLPLVARSPTGLKSHIHGYFVLDQNRRNLKWPDANRSDHSVTDRHHVWNIFMMKELVPRVLVQMAVYVSKAKDQDCLKSVTLQLAVLHKLMPNDEKVNPSWKPMVATFYQELVNCSVFFSKAENGIWLRICDKDTIVDNSDDITELAGILREILIQCDMHLVSVPKFVISGIEQHSSDCVLRKIEPVDICRCFRIKSIALTDEKKLSLLNYLLKKLEIKNELKELIGLPLLPLDNQKWTNFELASPTKEKVYIENSENPQELLPGLGRLFVRRCIQHNPLLTRIADSGIMQLEILKKASLLRLLSCIPGLKASSEDRADVTTIPNRNCAHLTLKWFKLIWKYIEKQCISDLPTLAHSKLYLIPFKQAKEVVLLCENLPLIMWNENENKCMKEVLMKLGVCMLDDLPSFVSQVAVVVDKYILKPNLLGIFEALKRIREINGEEKLIHKFKELTNEYKAAFCSYISLRFDLEMKGGLDYGSKRILQMLPCFLSLDKSGFKQEHFVSLKDCPLAVTNSFSVPFEVPTVLIRLKESVSPVFKKHLDIQTFNEAEVLCRFVFPEVNKNSMKNCLVEKVMKYCLNNLDVLEHGSSGFKKAMSQVKFLSGKNHKEQKIPGQFFDDSIELIQDLFCGCDVFPVGEFSKITYRAKLKMLGLKGLNQITVDDYLSAIDKLNSQTMSKGTTNRARALQILLNRTLDSGNFSNDEIRELKQTLSSRKWMLPKSKRPDDYPVGLAFIGEDSSLLCPKEVCLDRYSYVVGSVKATTDMNGLEVLVKCFELNKEPTVKDVVRHLDNIVNISNAEAKTIGKRKHSDWSDRMSVVKLNKNVKRTCEMVYDFLNERAKQNQSYLSSLSEKNYIIISGQFMRASLCAFGSHLCYPPYLSGLPNDLADSYKDLWIAMKVRKQFDMKSYVQIIEELYNETGQEPLSKQKLDITLKLISECTSVDTESQPDKSIKVYLPDNRNILRLASELHFNDTFWLSTDPTDNSPLCHPRIAHIDAKKLGVASWRQKTIQQHKRQLPGQRFGQREKLVNRLKRILDGYPFDEGLLKELVQNADDAGATKIHFIKDLRELPSKRIFDSKWKPIQRCSLCVYNDKCFTQEDLEGIQSLGEGSKSSQRTKIGEYGIGFNCVYNLTDVPTFLTNVTDLGRVLCVMDPMLQHVEDASEDSPGFMFDEIDILRKKFPDVFAGYLQEHYGSSGTVFRFPLRKQASTISSNIVTEGIISKLFEDIKDEMGSCLIFLKNVREIALREIGPDGKIRDLFCVKAELSSSNQKKLDEFHRNCKEACSRLDACSILESIKAQEVVFSMKTMDTTDLMKTKQDWLIVQRLGFTDHAFLNENTKKYSETQQLNHLPLAGVAYPITEKMWSGQMKLFCFLPLPKAVSLPVHINGHFYLDSENRRSLWENDKADFRTEWNNHLMSDVAAQAYCTLIVELKNGINQKISNLKGNNQNLDEDALVLAGYQSVFPKCNKSDSNYVQLLAKFVYHILWKCNSDILPVYSTSAGDKKVTIEWMGPRGTEERKPCFDHLKTEVRKIFAERIHSNHNRHTQTVKVLRDVLLSFGFPLVLSSCDLYSHFLYSGLTMQYTSPDCILTFFANFKRTCKLLHHPCYLSETPFNNVHVFETVLRFCFDAKNFKDRVRQTPFLLTQDEFLQEFDMTALPFYTDTFDVAFYALRKFAHVNIADILKTANMTRDFTAADFISILPLLLRKDVFHGGNKTATFEAFSDHVQSQSFAKCPKKVLKNIWKFLSCMLEPRDYASLQDWCLLPVTLNRSELLFPVSKANTVIIGSDIEDNFDANILEALIKIDMPLLNEIYISPSTLLKFMNSKVHISCAVIHHLIGKKMHAIELNMERNRFLEFLSYHLDRWKDIPGARDAIKCLPIFEYFNGTIGSLVKFECYIMPEMFPKQQAIKWTSEEYAVFLMQKNDINSLLSFLECTYIQEDVLYSRYIFKNFHKFSLEGRLEHLTFVRDNMINSTTDAKLKASLKSLCFLNRSDGSSELLPASVFYDWTIDIFEIMQQPSDFPPQPFKNREWLEFLRLCGLISEVTEDHLLRYAKEVTKQTVSGEKDEPVHKKAKVLVECIMDLDDMSTTFANTVKTMAIVPAAVISKNLSILHPQKVAKSGSFIGYKESLEVSHAEFAWTTSDLLPSFATRKRKFLNRLEVCVKPPGAIVAQHLYNICTSVSEKAPDRKAKEEFCTIVKKIYTFLGDKEISKSDVDILTNSRCILVDSDNELVTAGQVVINMKEENEIRPYLYRLPTELYEYVKFFQKIDIAEDLQLDHYVRVLSKVFQKVGNAMLVPNDRRVTLKAFAGFLKQLHVKEAVDLTELILPSENGKLYSSSKLVIKNDIDLAHRIGDLDSLNFLIDFNQLDEYGLREITYTIFDKLPQCVRPSLLTDVLSEKMENASKFMEGTCTKRSKIWKIITAPQFTEGLLCLINSKADLIGDMAIEDKIKNLSKLRLYDVPSVVTYLEYKQNRIPHSEKECSFYVSNVGVDGITVYISEELHGIKDSVMLSTKLAILVNELLGGALQPFLVNVPPLFLCDPDEISSTLGQLGFHVGSRSKTSEKTRYLPKLGSFVPIAMHHMLQQGFLDFKKEDLVALECGDLEDSIYILVEIIERIPGSGDSSLSTLYRVKTGDDTEQTVNASDLYHFHSSLSFDETGALVPSQTVNEQNATSADEKILEFKEIIREIRKILIESRALPENQRKRVIKRLYLRWHPDKNPPELTDLCTKVVQMLQKMVENIDNLTTEESDSDIDFTDGQFFDAEHKHHRGSRFRSRAGNRTPGYSSASSGTFSFNFKFWDETAERHKNQNRSYHSQNASSSRSAYQQNFFSFNEAFAKQPNPQPQEAKRWMRQAEYDLESASHDSTKAYFEWSCYKYHQAAEKALKAIQFKRDSNQQFTHSLSSLSSGLKDQSVVQWIRRLEELIPNPAAMRYPNHDNYPRVPHDMYDHKIAEEVQLLASNIVKFAKGFVEN